MQRIGWYQLEESFGNDEISVVVSDPRNGEVVTYKLESLEDHDKLIEYLDQHRQVGSLKMAVKAIAE
ncbi:MAG: hypothetical protein MI751_07795 [Pseudomonadales bacterium]|uniref:hypothetical protein n=1 Tax=Alcanivorax sp. TaxID=1872427 RepID=UPI002589CBCC|nr:hypothetical protein [Alcanivorax sp.]MCG8437972.1 hypothetical protein [Pseudomonadales bacterium]